MENRERMVKCLEIFGATKFRTGRGLKALFSFPLKTETIYVQNDVVSGKDDWTIIVTLYTGERFIFREGVDLCDSNYESIANNLIREFNITTFGPRRSFWIRFPHDQDAEDELGKAYLLMNEALEAIDHLRKNTVTIRYEENINSLLSAEDDLEYYGSVNSIVEEVGQLAKLLKPFMLISTSTEKLIEISTGEELISKLGDVLFNVTLLGARHGIVLEDILTYNLEKQEMQKQKS